MDEELLFSMESALITTDSSAGPKDAKSYYSYVHKFIWTPVMQTHLTVCIMWVFFFFPVFFFCVCGINSFTPVSAQGGQFTRNV